MLAVWLILLALYLGFLLQFTKQPLIPWITSVFSALVLALSLSSGSGLSVSDAVEFLAVANTIAAEGSSTLKLEGASLPSRYFPFFSWGFVVPFNVLGGSGYAPALAGTVLLSLGIFGLSVFFTERFEARVALVLTGLVLVLPETRYFAIQPLLDVPFAVFALAIVFVCALCWQQCRFSNFSALLVGLLSAALLGLRPTGIFFLLPPLVVLYMRGGFRPGKLLVLLLPPALMLGAQVVYNYQTFGTLFRTGYHYWVPIPYDNFWLVFHWKYFWPNLGELFSQTTFVGLLLVFSVLVSFARGNSGVRQNLVRIRPFLLLSAISLSPLVVFHLFYFYFSSRFFIPVYFVLCVGCAVLAAPLFRVSEEQFRKGFLYLATLTAALMLAFHPGASDFDQAARLLRGSGKSFVVITERNPLLVSLMVPETEAVWVIDRTQEYASKAVAKEPMSEFAKTVTDWKSVTFEQLVANGAQPVMRNVFVEREKEFLELIAKKGEVVFLGNPAEEFLARLKELGVTIVRYSPELFFLRFPSSEPGTEAPALSISFT